LQKQTEEKMENTRQNTKICNTHNYNDNHNNNNNNYLLTPWGTVLLEKLTGFAASQEIPAFYGTRRFITVFTSARHLSLS